MATNARTAAIRDAADNASLKAQRTGTVADHLAAASANTAAAKLGGLGIVTQAHKDNALHHTQAASEAAYKMTNAASTASEHRAAATAHAAVATAIANNGHTFAASAHTRMVADHLGKASEAEAKGNNAGTGSATARAQQLSQLAQQASAKANASGSRDDHSAASQAHYAASSAHAYLGQLKESGQHATVGQAHYEQMRSAGAASDSLGKGSAAPGHIGAATAASQMATSSASRQIANHQPGPGLLPQGMNQQRSASPDGKPQGGPVQAGKKGGQYVMSASGKKRYVGKGGGGKPAK